MKKQFDNLGFVIIRNFISKNKAKKLSKEFKDFCDNNPNETQPDDQVKGAPAYHNHEAFVELLSTKTSKVSKILKERILPSYSYARVYQKGNILEKHVDRKSCEISLTVHLDGDQEWEFYIEDKIGEVHEIVLTSGDAILYSGREVLHWRNEYKGSFYSQTFLHYVKSSGICKHNYFENTLNDLSKYIHIYKNFIPNELCDEIIEEYRNDTEWAKSKVVSGFNPKVRDCSVVNISTSKSSKKKKKIDNDICNYMNKIIKEELQIYPELIITQDTGYNLLRYTKGQFYMQHVDSNKEYPRELSCSIILNDDYEGGEFSFFNNTEKYKLTKGSAIVFPSNFLFPHQILPVTEGVRYSIITWFN